MNDTSKSKERDTYYREAGSWAADQSAAAYKAVRRAWLVAGCAGAIALFEAIALIALTPLKTVVPYTLLVDRHTGFVQALAPLDAQKIAPDSALTQSFLAQYVIARESFDIATVQADYKKTLSWSTDTARRDYASFMQASNAASPLVQYPRSTTIETVVKSVSPLRGNKALVRFLTQRRDSGGQPLLLGNWVAIIGYRYSLSPMSLEDRFINPLGFEILTYHKDQESLPLPEPAVPTFTGNAAPVVSMGTAASPHYPMTLSPLQQEPQHQNNELPAPNPTGQP